MGCALFLLLALGLGWAADVAAGIRVVPASRDAIEIYVRQGVPLAVQLPERIAAIPNGVDPAELSLEIEGRRLFIQSLTEDLDARLFVIGGSGRMYQLQLLERAGEADDQVDVVVPVAPPVFGVEESPGPDESGGRRAGFRQPGSPSRRLLAAMFDGGRLPGVSVFDHAQILYAHGDLEIATEQLYVAGRYLGYVAVASNRGTTPLALRLPEYRARGLRAITARHEIIPARGTTRVYLIIEPGRER